jgi:hypothetical protein
VPNTTVVYVHGNGNKPSSDSLKRQWDLLLFGEPGGDRSRMVYYADLHYQAPLPDETPSELVALEALKDTEPRSPEDFSAELRADIQADGVQPADELLTLAQRMAAEAAVVDDTTLIKEGNLELLPSKWLRTHAIQLVTRTFFKDVHRYFFSDSGREIRDRMHEQLRNLTGAAVVVSHSLGTIVAYDTLHEMAEAHLDVPLLVTLGCPLGIQEIQDHVRRPLDVPPGTARWRNVADLFDVVALDKTIADEYAPNERCEDLVVKNQTANHHSISGYLDKPQARLPVLEHFGRGLDLDA